MIIISRIGWMAGLIEGEGSFLIQGGSTPVITITSTDEDVIRKVARIWDRPYHETKRSKLSYGYKLQYRVNICASPAIEWIFTIYSLLGIRRKEQALHVINEWKKVPYRDPNKFICGHPRIYSNTSYKDNGTSCKTCARDYVRRRRLNEQRKRRQEPHTGGR